MSRSFLSYLIGALLITGVSAAAEKPFVSLFDGKTLNGWEVCNGFASYTVENGTIVGTTADKSPNSFLCSKKEYGDFVLEFETKTDPALNSGVQIRSHRYAADTKVMTFDGKKIAQQSQKAGRVYGYQVEVANEKGGASGGIYDEARRGWLHNISSDPVARTAFKDNQWNKYRVVAMGDSIKVWINGIACANMVDSQDQTGFIGLQVHGYKGEKPAQVAWRNIRIQDLGKHVWKPIWDGKTLAGWTPGPGGKWTVEDGAIHGSSVADDPRIAFLMSDASFKDVTARVQFKITKGNSGFFMRTDPKTRAAYEVEIDEAKRTGGLWETGGRNWVTGPEDNAAVKQNDWNELTASLHGHRITFHVNGVKTLDLPDDVKGRLEGHIGLQAHGSKRETDVWFKNIEILVPDGKK